MTPILLFTFLRSFRERAILTYLDTAFSENEEYNIRVSVQGPYTPVRFLQSFRERGIFINLDTARIVIFKFYESLESEENLCILTRPV